MNDLLRGLARLAFGDSRQTRTTTSSTISQLYGGSLPTAAISVVSHTHGRQRREERGIRKEDLQQAIKYGRKERANPGAWRRLGNDVAPRVGI
jgi:hypothetical protein